MFENSAFITKALIYSKSLSIFLPSSAQKFYAHNIAQIVLSTVLVASYFRDQKQKENWVVGSKALLLDPDVASTESIGGEARANSDFVPMLDVRYFIRRDISLETMWGYSEHK